MARDEEAPGTEDSQKVKAFVGGISHTFNRDDLLKAFERYDATDAEIMKDKLTGKPRGFGFVYFKDERGLQDAIKELHEKELDGRRISVVKAVPQSETRPGTPAGMLGAGPGARSQYAPPRREFRDHRGGYDRYPRGGNGYDRGYGGYDPRYAYDRGYDSHRYGPYDRDPYHRDAHYREPYYGGYDRYDDRGAGGPDRRGYSSGSRGSPYDRPRDRSPRR